VLLPAWRPGLAPSRLHTGVAAALGLGLVITTAAVGHPVAGSWPGLVVVVTTVHVGGMAIWLGGLAGLIAGVLRPGESFETLGAALPRFSRLAFASVSALVVTGVVQAVREVGSLSALTGTTYGRVLLAKLVLVLVILAAAGESRVWVQQRLSTARPRRGSVRRVDVHAFADEGDAALGEPDEPIRAAAAGRVAVQARAAADDLPAFRRSVLVEFAVGVVVLALSAVLVGSPPAKAVQTQPLDVTLPLQSSSGPKGSVQISVDPGRPGPNTLHLYLFDPQGQLIQPRQITVTLTEPERQIGPIDVKLQPGGPGHYLADAMSVPSAGTWTIAVTLRLDEFTAVTASTKFPVR
jgi:copper transport protein